MVFLIVDNRKYCNVFSFDFLVNDGGISRFLFWWRFYFI